MVSENEPTPKERTSIFSIVCNSVRMSLDRHFVTLASISRRWQFISWKLKLFAFQELLIQACKRWATIKKSYFLAIYKCVVRAQWFPRADLKKPLREIFKKAVLDRASFKWVDLRMSFVSEVNAESCSNFVRLNLRIMQQYYSSWTRLICRSSVKNDCEHRWITYFSNSVSMKIFPLMY